MVLARGGDRRPHGGWVVRVIVHDDHPLAPRQNVEPAANAAKRVQRRGDPRERNLQHASRPRLPRARSDVHLAGNAQLDAAQTHVRRRSRRSSIRRPSKRRLAARTSAAGRVRRWSFAPANRSTPARPKGRCRRRRSPCRRRAASRETLRTRVRVEEARRRWRDDRSRCS